MSRNVFAWISVLLIVGYFQAGASGLAAGGISAPSDASALLEKPSPPTLVSPANGSADLGYRPTFTWNPSPGATSYVLQIARWIDQWQPDILALDVGNIVGTSYAPTSDLGGGGSYFWRVCAVSGSDSSDWSSIFSFTTYLDVPYAPLLYQPENGAVGVVPYLTPIGWWNNTYNAPDRFELQVAKDAAFAQIVHDENDLSSEQRVVTGLQPGILYYWRVRGMNEIGWGPWSEVWHFTTYTLVPLPVELFTFTGVRLAHNKGVELNWSTASETNNYGFEIQRSLEPKTGFSTLPNSFIAGHGTSLERHDYSYIDEEPPAGTSYYRLVQTDLDGTVNYSDAISVGGITAITSHEIPQTYELKQNFPNPFNPGTFIEFSLPREVRVTLEVYNLLGSREALLIDQVMPPGSHVVRFDASGSPTGVYLYRLSTPEITMQHKMILLK